MPKKRKTAPKPRTPAEMRHAAARMNGMMGAAKRDMAHMPMHEDMHDGGKPKRKRRGKPGGIRMGI